MISKSTGPAQIQSDVGRVRDQDVIPSLPLYKHARRRAADVQRTLLRRVVFADQRSQSLQQGENRTFFGVRKPPA
jgi:hypothetical protein